MEWLKKLKVEAVCIQYLQEIIHNNSNNYTTNAAVRNEEVDQIIAVIDARRKMPSGWPIKYGVAQKFATLRH